GINGGVNALAVSGTDLYAGGGFTTAGGSAANYIAKWDGSSWSALGPGMGPAGDDPADRRSVVDGERYAVGGVSTAGRNEARCSGRWKGGSWSALGSGMNGAVFALAVSGSDLYAGGFFTTAGGNAANYIARWDGSSWSALGSGIGPSSAHP